MSKMLKRLVEAKANGQEMSKFIDKELAALPGSRGGLQVLEKSNRGGADGSTAGHAGQRLQFPWDPKLIDALCRRQPKIGNGNEWASIVAEDVDNGFLVSVSTKRLSERYETVDENGDPIVARTILTGDGVDYASNFRGSNDAEAFVNGLEELGGRTVDLDEVPSFERTLGEQTFTQRYWKAHVEDNVHEGGFMWAIHHWDELTVDEKSATLKLAKAAGLDASAVEGAASKGKEGK